MQFDLIKAHLNLYAVLQNLEDLVKLDGEAAALTREWDISIQFIVRRGPAAWVAFKGGVCRHGIGAHTSPAVKLYFLSPAHLNKMFDGKGNPIPLKGFSKLGFLARQFSKLTQRLEFYLKPKDGAAQDPDFKRINTTLTLFTATHAVRELAQLDATCKKVASHTPAGILQISVLPDGPDVSLTVQTDAWQVTKGKTGSPTATMTFRDMDAAHALLNNQLDSFQAVGEGKVMLRGMLPIIDNVGLILDRVAGYLV